MENQVNKDNEIKVFLAGLLSEPEIIYVLTGKPVNNYEITYLEDYQLVVQTLEQIPLNVQDLLRDTWGDDFQSYAVIPGIGRIKGIICKISQDQWQRLCDWELVQKGWTKPHEVELIDNKSQSPEFAMTLILEEGQKYNHVVESDDYNPYLMDKEKTLKIAAKIKTLYDKIHSENREGLIAGNAEIK